jgi:hypothetical protein
MDHSRNSGSPLPLRLARVLLGLLNVALLIALALVLLPQLAYENFRNDPRRTISAF